MKKKVAQELLYQRWERVHSQLGSGCEDGGDDGDDDVEDDGGGTQQLEASWGIPGHQTRDQSEGYIKDGALQRSLAGHKNSLCAKLRSLVFAHWWPHCFLLCIQRIHILHRFLFRFYGVARGLLIHTRTRAH